MFGTEAWVWLYRYDTPATFAKAGANRKEVGACGAYLDHDPACSVGKERAPNDFINIIFCGHRSNSNPGALRCQRQSVGIPALL